MESHGITIDKQLTQASRLVSECSRHQSDLLTIQNELQGLIEQRDTEQAQIRQSIETALARRLEETQQHAQSQLETLQLDSTNQLESLQESYDRNSRKSTADLKEEVAELEELRRSETWILQSVLDEEMEDSPVTRFEREAETFVTQKSFLDDRFELQQQQLAQARNFLEQCHSSTDETMPAANIDSGTRQAMQDTAVEEGDKALAKVAELATLHLPQWVKGFRIWGFSVLAFILLWIPILAIKADLLQFINPELSRPPWEWAGVAAVIALAVVVLVAMTVLMMVQSRLRRRFELAMQHISNAEYARTQWEQKSQKNIDRMEESASQWRQKIEERRRAKTEKIQTEIDAKIHLLQSRHKKLSQRLETEFQQRSQLCETERATTESRIFTQQEADLKAARNQSATQLAEALQSCEQRFKQATDSQREAATALLQAWNSRVDSLRRLSKAASSVAAPTLRWPGSDWLLPQSMPECISVGDLLITAAKPPGSFESSTQSSLCVEMPAVLRFPTDTSVLVEHDSQGRDVALSFLRTQILKLLTVIPAGRIRLTLIDPVGLGQSFSAMMHLSDFDELLIHSRIWTESTQIRDQLQKVTEHMENIFQTYLRSQFQSIEEYNESAGEVAEPYHFVVIAGFPTAFTEDSARHLSSILTSGPRCGVHALVAWNPSIATPTSFDDDDLTNSCVRFRVQDNRIQPVEKFSPAVLFEHFPEPESERYVQLVREAGEQSKDARRVEVSFNRVAPRPDEIWSHSTADGIDLPIGRAGAARLQFMRLGRGTSQHALVAGKTGSGKSTFLHILITNLALHYSPDEIQFFLIDFKKGVEFRTYAANRLPHARVVAIESDREFGLSVLERLDQMLQERGELFRERGVQDVPSFRERFPTEPMPRLLLLIDEFQEFFTAEDRVSARASLLLDRLVRQGRAFGIHVLLGSQTLGGAYSLARSTMGQIAVRIALQCSENDAHLILSEDNMAARTLTRPGEAIYNDANGMVQGNHQFQIAWLEESQREQAISQMVSHKSTRAAKEHSMVVFEGNVAPTVEFCAPLNAHLSGTEDATRRPGDGLRIWLGEPVAIAAPTSIDLRRASGQNVLIVGQDENQVDSILACSILSSCTTTQPENATVVPRVTFLHDGRDAESLQQLTSLQQTVRIDSMEVTDPSKCDSAVEQIYQEVVAREENSELASGPERILIVRNIGQFRSLRKEEDDYGLGGFGEPKKLTIASMFSDILKRGSLVGVHVIVWSDTFSNAVRWLSTSLLREFEFRIAFRMNQTDSASLVDNPVAASLAQGRALVYRDQSGTTEKFRPFAWPSQEWLAGIANSGPSDPTNDFDIDSLIIE